MINEREFETALEALNSEIENLPDGAVKSNLEDIHGVLYGIFEDLAVENIEIVIDQHAIMRDLLISHLSREDRFYYQRKHDIDLGV